MDRSTNRTFSVIIADDESLICDLLKSLIHWDDLSLTLLDVCNNGYELQDSIALNKPDIVITDICMPEVSGIDLIKQIRDLGIPCRFIIVSGYRQFEYAHKALRYDVDSYLLKPIDENELNEVLRKTVEALQNQIPSRSMLTDQNGFQRLLMNHILSASGSSAILSLEQINREFNTSFNPGLFRYTIIKLDLQGHIGDTSINALTLTDKIARIIVRHMEPVCTQILYCCNIDSISLLVNYRSDMDIDVMGSFRDAFGIGAQFTDLFIGLHMTMGISAVFTDLNKCSAARNQSLCALWCRILLNDQCIITYEDLGVSEEVFADPGLANHRQRLLTAIDNLNEAVFSQTARDLITGMTDINYVVRTGILLRQLCEPIAEKLGIMLGKKENTNYLLSELINGLSASFSQTELERCFFMPIIEFIRQLHSESDQRARLPIRQAVAYMEKNYRSPLKLDDVAAQVYLSPHYFSSLFIHEMGQSFSDYLITLRIETAKRMLRESNLSISEIAASVGYQDSRYFSRLFMQKVGIKPKDYRKIYS